MSRIHFVAADGLPGLLDSLSRKVKKVLVPVEKPAASKTSIVFEPWQKGSAFTLHKAFVPPKFAGLPECEVLFTFKNTRSKEDFNVLETALGAAPEGEETVIFGCRPCDARGFAAFDNPFLKGIFEDPYYKARREKLTIITHTCDTGCETCFCHWVGGGPTSPIGSDVLMTKIADGYVLQAMTPRGEKLLDDAGVADGADKMPAAEEVRKKAWASLKPAPKLDAARESLKKLFTDDEFWTHWTNRCLSCGACTYFCPTCYCFNITDEGHPGEPEGGRRLRSWDNCMSARYTREASGHNPRADKFQRMRNRVSHKFWTYPENWGSYLCSGCGRCVTNCPVHLDIREIVLAAIDKAQNGKTEGKE